MESKTRAYRVWEGYVPDHEYASVQTEIGLSIKQKQDVRWGRRLESPPEQVTITTLTMGELPDVASSGWGGRYVSFAVKQILRRYCSPEEVQFVPAQFAAHLGNRGRSYWLLNVTTSRACFDWERSEYETHSDAPDVLNVVRKMVLEPLPADALPLFHLEELVFILLVRDDLGEALRTKTRSPGHFTPTEEFTYGMW